MRCSSRTSPPSVVWFAIVLVALAAILRASTGHKATATN